MKRMLGPETWDQLTKLQEKLKPSEKIKIKSLCRTNQLGELVEFINEKLNANTEENKTYIPLKEKDEEALKYFFTSYKDSFVKRWVGGDFYNNMETLLENADTQQQNHLADLKDSLPGNLWFYQIKSWVSNFFRGIGNVGLFVINLFRTNKIEYWGWREPYDENARGQLITELNKFTLPTSLSIDEDNLDDAILMIPDKENEDDSNPMSWAVKKFAGSLPPDPRKLQQNWQQAFFILSFLAAMIILFAFPHVLAPVLTAIAVIPWIGPGIGSMVMGTSLLALVSKLFFAWSLTKLPPLIVDFVATKIVSSSDNTKPVLHVPSVKPNRGSEAKSYQQISDGLGVSPVSSCSSSSLLQPLSSAVKKSQVPQSTSAMSQNSSSVGGAVNTAKNPQQPNPSKSSH